LLESPAVSGGAPVVAEDDAHAASGESVIIRHNLAKALGILVSIFMVEFFGVGAELDPDNEGVAARDDPSGRSRITTM
jgi:hypothetical protein